VIKDATRTSKGLLICPLVATTAGPEDAPSGTRATTKSSDPISTEAGLFAKSNQRLLEPSGRKLAPRKRTSPPGKAARGDTESKRGSPLF